MRTIFRQSSGRRIPIMIAGIAALGVIALPAVASAQASNDDFASAAVITALPFSDVVDNTTATTEPGEPADCNAPRQTVWYSITPASSMVLQVDMTGSSFFDTAVNVYQQTGSGFAGLSLVNCNGFGGVVRFRAQAGTTYYIQAGNSCCTNGGSLALNVHQIPPPANDNFANATAISQSAVPFGDTEDGTSATTEPGEPQPTCSTQISNSWWYSFTPTSSGSYIATASQFDVTLAVYTGSGLSNLTQIGCHSQEVSDLNFQATAGTTYYLQVADLSNGNNGPVTFRLDHTPQPIANFVFFPSDPSTFDTVGFLNLSTDPAQLGITRDVYDFGDGTTAAGCCASQFGAFDAFHQYAADGDYTVTDTVTASDGRTATVSQVVHVRTHDVAITKFSVPTSASAGQTRSITVGVSDQRYPETVQVELLRGNTQGGFDVVGILNQSIPATTGKSTVSFAFSYTFTQGDATLGKVTFEAVARIVDARDAIPADNTAIAAPTIVH